MDDFADLVHFDSDDEEYLIKAAEAMPNQTTREEDPEVQDSTSRKENCLDFFKSGRDGLSVTDLVNQYWCEQQFEYTFSAPIVKPVPAIVSAGSSIHLERELEIHDIVPVAVETKEDAWAVKFLNTYQQLTNLSQGQTIRELSVFGSLFNDDVFIQGIIDEIRYNDHGLLEVRELKTRSVRSPPSKAQHNKNRLQVSIYRKLLEDLLVRKRGICMVKEHVELDWGSKLNEEVISYSEELGLSCLTLEEVGKVLTNFLEIYEFPLFGDSVIEYCYQENKETICCCSCEYDESKLKDTILKQYEYLQGRRRACGVDIEEAWKCRTCDYSEICSWRESQEMECQKKNSSNFDV